MLKQYQELLDLNNQYLEMKIIISKFLSNLFILQEQLIYKFITKKVTQFNIHYSKIMKNLLQKLSLNYQYKVLKSLEVI